jgi:hypothetical protein
LRGESEKVSRLRRTRLASKSSRFHGKSSGSVDIQRASAWTSRLRRFAIMG